MKKNFLYFLLITALSTFTFVACGGDDDPDPEPDPDPVEDVDKEKPTISLTTPKAGDEFENNGTASILLNGTLKDNKELDSCYVSVSYNDKSASSLKSTDDLVEFNDEKSYSLSGTEHTFTNEDPFETTIENATPGEYTFTIKVFDAAGNKEEDSFNITIKEPTTE
ncbi:DUF4625 domain-containing protein [Thermophagus xiamenensis]|nr:DUF4625 domain-containing protein [Thermophagus xiamenensis]